MNLTIFQYATANSTEYNHKPTKQSQQIDEN